MTQPKFHHPKTFDPNAPARSDAGIFGLLSSPDQSRVILLPVPVEITTSYGAGTANGPAAILAASHQVDLFDAQNGFPYAAGICCLDPHPRILEIDTTGRKLASPIKALGGSLEQNSSLVADLLIVNNLMEELNRNVYESTHFWLQQKKLVGVIGGDHSAPFGAIQALAEHYSEIGILHIDAHADLRSAYEGFTFSHASIMHNVYSKIPAISRIVQVAVRDLCEQEMELITRSENRICTFFDHHIQKQKHLGVPFSQIIREIVSHLPSHVYVSFDIDGLDPALCPHTGTPVPGGLSFWEAMSLLEEVVESGRQIVGFDLCEVAPGMDDEWDANVGARVLYKMIGFALRARPSNN